MDSSGNGLAVGKNSPRVDGRAKVEGSALYVDDLRVPGLWHGMTVRSPHPRARIVGIDVEQARASDPDIVVVTAGDLAGRNFLHVIVDDWPVLAEREVRHVAEPVALVAAPTRERARAAAAAIIVRYEPLPATTTLEEALANAATGHGILAACALHHGDVEAVFGAGNAIVVDGLWSTGHQEHLYLETQGVIAVPTADGGIEILGSMQCPYYVHKALVPLFGLDPRALRVVQTTTGGGFGGKEEFPDAVAAHAALLARAAGRPVKIVYDRHEDLVATTKRHPSRVRHRSAVAPDGTLLALDIDVVLDAGAYTTLSPVVLSRAVLHAGGPYRCSNVRIRGRALATNTVPNGAFRGFGAPQSQFAMERQMDRIAAVVGLDPLSIRERNAYRPGDVTPTGQVLDASTSALACLAEAERKAGFRAAWRANETARATRADDGRPWSGIGLALFWHGAGFTGNGERRLRSAVRLRLAPGPVVEVRVASTEFGQGTQTVLAQLVAGTLAIPAERVVVVTPDTAEVPDSGPTVASRTVMVVGGILVAAAEALRERVAELARESGTVVAKDAESFLAASALVVARFGAQDLERSYEPDPAVDFDETTYRGTAYRAYGFGCDVVEVTVDPDTFAIQPTKAVLVADVGRAVHPVLCAGQVEGGSLQAFGFAYLEEIRLQQGRVLNDRLATCLVPTAKDAPRMETILLEHPTSAGPFGAKGVGEMPMDGGAPALVQAIENATGLGLASLPASPEALFAASAGRAGEAQ